MGPNNSTSSSGTQQSGKNSLFHFQLACNIRVLCRPADDDTTATQAQPEEPCKLPSQPELPNYLSDEAMPVPALPPASPPQQELSVSIDFSVSFEQLDAIKAFLPNAGASNQCKCDPVLSTSLKPSVSSHSAKPNDEKISSAQPHDNNSACA